MDLVCKFCIWRESGLRNTPRGSLEWAGMRGRVYSASVGRDPVATVRRNPHRAQWTVSLPGFE